MNRKRILFNYLAFWVKKNYSQLLLNVNKRNELLQCIGDNDIDKFTNLINRFNIHFQDKEKNSLLHYACLGGRVDFVEKLISLGADINHRNIRNETPLITTFIIKPPFYKEIITIFFNNQPNLKIKDAQDKDAFHYICELSDISLFTLIFKQKLHLEKINYHYLISAFKGCRSNNLESNQTIEILELFFQNGYDINFKNSSNHGLLHHFVASYDQNLFEYALNKKIEIFIGKDDILDFVLKNGFSGSKEFSTILAKHFLGTNSFDILLDRIELNYSNYNSYYKMQFIAELKEMEISHRKDSYELSLPLKTDKPAKRVKI